MCVAFSCIAVYFVVFCTLNPVTRKRIGIWEDSLHFWEIQDESLLSIRCNQSTQTHLDIIVPVCLTLFLHFLFETRSCSVSWAALRYVVLLPLPPLIQ